LTRESPYPIDIEPTELTNRTFSLAMDVGMYLSQVLITNVPGLRWEHPLGGLKFVDYGQPVLRGPGRVPLNPVGLIVTLAYGIARKRQSGQRLGSSTTSGPASWPSTTRPT
jgi:hypothetical protein